MISSSKNFKSYSNGIAIDLGTANTLVYLQNKGIVINEPSVVVMIKKGVEKVPYAFGNQAKMMLGRTHNSLEAKTPLKDGVIADFNAAEEMLKYFIRRVNNTHSFFSIFELIKKAIVGFIVIICVPSGSTPVERRAIQEAAESVGAREVFLIEESMAAAIGAELPVTKPTGSMIVDIGGGTTEIAVISLGGIVYSRSIRVGGYHMEEAIISYIRRNHNLLIGTSTAEKIKKKIGSAMICIDDKVTEMKIRGRDLVVGIPKEITLTSKEINESLKDIVNTIIEGIKRALEASPPELSSDIVSNGIFLSGGGSLLKNLDIVIKQETKLSVTISSQPLFCVANGIGKVLENLNELKSTLFKQN